MITRRGLFKAILAVPAVAAVPVVFERAVHWFGERSPSSNFADMVAVALRQHRGELVDNVTKHNALFKHLKERKS